MRLLSLVHSGTRKYTNLEVKEIRDWVSGLVQNEAQNIDNQVKNSNYQVCLNIKNVA